MTRVQNPNHPVTGLQFAPQTGSNTTYPSSWYDLTTKLKGWKSKQGKQRELGLAEAGTLTLNLLDKDESLNPANTSSTFNSGGNSLKLYRPVRLWEMPYVSAGSWAGNLINSTNDVWLTVRSNTGSYTDSASFEGGTVGGWSAPTGSTTTVANSAVRAHDGTKSMVVTWPTQVGGGSGANASINLPGVPYRKGDSYTVSIWLWINAGPAVVLYSNGWAVTSSATTGAWQRVTLTFTASDSDNDIWLWPSNSTTAGQQVWVDSVQVEYASSASTFTTTGPTVWPVFTGFIERYPKSWNYMGFYGMCQLVCTDALGMIPRVKLLSALDQEIVLDAPTYWWAFDDGINAGGIFNQKGSSQDPQIQSWIGGSASGAGGSVSSAQSLTTRGGPGADQPGYLFVQAAWASGTSPPTAPAAGADFKQSWATANLIGGSAAGFSVEFWFNPQSTGGWVQKMLVMSGTKNYRNDSYEFGIDTAGNLTYRYYNAASVALESITSAGGIFVSFWNQLVMTTSSSGGTITTRVYLNGSLVTSVTRASATVPTRQNMIIGTNWAAGTDQTLPTTGFEPFYGYISNLSIYQGKTLSASHIASRYNCGEFGYEGDYTGQRIKRILTYAGWAGYTNIADVTGVQQGQIRGLDGAFTADAIKVAADTDWGLVYAAPSGMLQYLPQSTIAASTSTLTFGELTGSGEIPYREGATEELEPSQVYNYVTVNPNALPKTDLYLQSVYVSDATSIQDYGVRTYSLDIQARDSSTGLSQLQAMAAFQLAQKKNPRLMVQGVQINLGARPSLWPTALAFYLGQCVTWKRRTSAGVTITFTGYIQTINWDEDPQAGAICTVDIEPIQV